MKPLRVLTCLVLFMFSVFMPLHATGEKNAKIELIDPFASWFLTERLDFYVRVTNVGNEPLPLAWLGRNSTDLYFEVAAEDSAGNEELNSIPRDFLPKIELAEKPSGWCLILQAGRAYVLNDADFNEVEFMIPERFTRVRVNLLLEKGRWVSSEWAERTILPSPDLNGEPLYEFLLDPLFGTTRNKVLPIKMGEETWLFSHHSGNSRRVGRRLCRVPQGVSVSSIHHDMETRRLAIQFDGGEQPVVINTRTGLPLTGSERTVPHLHLWRRLSGRPFTDVYQQLVERQQGKRDELDRSRTTVPALPVNDEAFSAPVEPADAESHPQDPLPTSFPKSRIDSGSSKPNRVGNPLSFWVGGIAILLTAVLFLWLRCKNRKDVDRG